MLWDLAKRRVAATDTYHSGPRKTNLDHLVDHAISLAQDGMYTKASHILASAGLAPNNDSTWQMLQAKHPKGPLPSFNTAEVAPEPLSVPEDFGIFYVLKSFQKGTAAGPSGLRVHHLLDAAAITLPTSIYSLLRGVVNLLASGKAPREVSIFLAGGSLTALNKLIDGCPSDVRPIAVGEVLRHLIGKCLCALVISLNPFSLE